MDHVVIEERYNDLRKDIRYVPLVYGTAAQCNQIAAWMSAHCEVVVPHTTLRFTVSQTAIPTPEQAQTCALDWVRRLLCASVGPSFTDAVGKLLKEVFPAAKRGSVTLTEALLPTADKPPQEPPTGP